MEATQGRQCLWKRQSMEKMNGWMYGQFLSEGEGGNRQQKRRGSVDHDDF